MEINENLGFENVLHEAPEQNVFISHPGFQTFVGLLEFISLFFGLFQPGTQSFKFLLEEIKENFNQQYKSEMDSTLLPPLQYFILER